MVCPAQVSVEALSPAELDYTLLEGKWLLQYTDALDVVSTQHLASEQAAALSSCKSARAPVSRRAHRQLLAGHFPSMV